MKTRSYNILVVDDDAAIALVVPTILRRLGHVVEVAYNGKEAIQVFTLHPGRFDVLITDHSMPELNGLDLVQHLRKNGFEGKMIVMSGSLNEELIVAYKAKRVDKILQKPFTIESLSTALSDLFERWSGDDGSGT